MDPLSTAATNYRSSQIKDNKTRLLYLEGLPLSRRSISEVQLMHNVREHKEMLERQDWLQLKLNNIIIPSLNDSQKGKTNGPSIRRLRKGEGAAWILN
uniref:Parathyroid hormone n=1 Tax=Cyprinus carpio carpio TaxID=630221 RepID=A0A9J7ZGV5_CYPCA